MIFPIENIFSPLAAKQGGVLRRTGHTEAAIDLREISSFNWSYL
jgi:3,4-dihydroxy-2-butanone 4-phosphate synthase